jgi:hypothetical protein
MNSDLGKASSFSLTQKNRHFTQTGYGGVSVFEILKRAIINIWLNFHLHRKNQYKASEKLFN